MSDSKAIIAREWEQLRTENRALRTRCDTLERALNAKVKALEGIAAHADTRNCETCYHTANDAEKAARALSDDSTAEGRRSSVSCEECGAAAVAFFGMDDTPLCAKDLAIAERNYEALAADSPLHTTPPTEEEK